MDKMKLSIIGILGIMLIIGVIAFSGILNSAKGAESKIARAQNLNVSDVKYKVTVEKPSVALFEEAAQGPPAAKGSSELTVYNQNLALVKDVRALNLEKGINLVQFRDIASQIDSTSVFFRDLKYPSSFVVEQSYQYDLVSTEKILEKYLDKEITILANEGNIVKEYKGKLLSYSGGIVLQTSSGIVTINSYSNISFPELPGGLLTKPTLVWKIYSDNAGAGTLKQFI